MNLEKYEVIEACNSILEDLLLQEIELKIKENRTKYLIEKIQESLETIEEDRLDIIYSILNMYIEEHSLLLRSLLVIRNNKQFYTQRLEEILRS